MNNLINNIEKAIQLGNEIIELTAEALGVTMDDLGLPTLYANGKEIGVSDSLFLEVNKPINVDDFFCDGILFFGDGTLELHDADNLDAYNWSMISVDGLEKIKEYLVCITL